MLLDGELYLKVKRKILSEEGMSNKMYVCPAGFNTIGIGHNLDDNKISNEAVDVIFKDDLKNILKEIDESFPWLENHPDDVKIVLIDLAFNMGMPRLKKFKNTLKMIERGEYARASYALLKSRYARQVKNRANRNSELLRSAKLKK